jgi:hypothetical protein
VQQLTTLRIELVRLLCGFAEQFSVSDLYRNAASFRNHRFLRTGFNIQQVAERTSIYYCRCGELAVRDGSTGNFISLAPGGVSQKITVCKLPKSDHGISRTVGSSSDQARDYH